MPNSSTSLTPNTPVLPIAVAGVCRTRAADGRAELPLFNERHARNSAIDGAMQDDARGARSLGGRPRKPFTGPDPAKPPGLRPGRLPVVQLPGGHGEGAADPLLTPLPEWSDLGPDEPACVGRRRKVIAGKPKAEIQAIRRRSGVASPSAARALGRVDGHAPGQAREPLPVDDQKEHGKMNCSENRRSPIVIPIPPSSTLMTRPRKEYRKEPLSKGPAA